MGDGFICHGFTTERYLRETIVPALERGRSRAGTSMDDFEIVGPPFVVTGSDQAEIDEAAARTRQQIGFYGSTPAYRGVLEVHGWGELGEELHRRTRAGEWASLGELIDDEVLQTFAVVGPLDTIADQLRDRYADVATRVRFSNPNDVDPRRWLHVAEALRGG